MNQANLINIVLYLYPKIKSD